jgi:hypothetical protein
MRDLAGFAILILVIVVGLYLLVQVVFPLLLTYVFGLLSFFIVSEFLVRRSRLHPVHLDSLLRPGVAGMILLLAFALPIAHGAFLLLLSDVDLWWVVLLANLVPSLALGIRSGVLHRRQKVQYVTEGHDIEDLIEWARSRDAALEIFQDALGSSRSEPREPEPWAEVGMSRPESRICEAPDVATVPDRIARLRETYSRLARTLGETLEEVRSGAHASSPAEVLNARAHLLQIEPLYAEIRADVRSAIADDVSEEEETEIEEVRD